MKKAVLIGNIGQDAKLCEHQGKKFISFSMAVNEGYKDKDGNYIQSTEWVNCTSHNLNLFPHLQTGKKIYVEGKFRLRSYQDKTGAHRASMSVSVMLLEFLSSNQKEEKEQTAAVSESNDGEEGDLPF